MRSPLATGFLFCVFVSTLSTAGLLAQSVTVNVMSDALHVKAPGIGVIRGTTLDRLKNGSTVRVDFELSVMAGPGAKPSLQSRQTFVLSYDLWEERFAVTRAESAGVGTRSVSHLTSTAAEEWCVEQLSVPVSALGRIGRDAPFWLRLEYQLQDGDGRPREDDSGFSLRGMVDALSRRRRADATAHALEAGPFRLPK